MLTVKNDTYLPLTVPKTDGFPKLGNFTTVSFACLLSIEHRADAYVRSEEQRAGKQ
jgi:hypothetical protein